MCKLKEGCLRKYDICSYNNQDDSNHFVQMSYSKPERALRNYSEECVLNGICKKAWCLKGACGNGYPMEHGATRELSACGASHLLKSADLPTLGRPTRMMVGRSAASTLVKSTRDCFIGLLLGLPLGFAEASDISATVEYENPAENGRRGRRGKARAASGSWTVRRGGLKGLVWEGRGILPRGVGGSGTGGEGRVRGRRRAAAAGRLRRRAPRTRTAAAPIFRRKCETGRRRGFQSWAGQGMVIRSGAPCQFGLITLKDVSEFVGQLQADPNRQKNYPLSVWLG